MIYDGHKECKAFRIGGYMRIAICQYQIQFEDKSYNLEAAKNWIWQASKEAADFIVFPEMSFTGFSMNQNCIGESDFETMKTLQELAKMNRIAIGFGWVKNVGDEIGQNQSENHYSILSKSGEVILDYAKIHPFSYSGEDLFYQKGSSMSMCQVEEFKISTVICYDLRFPELFQHASKYADIILVPANWPETRREHWLTLLRARAIENQCYVVGINCTGKSNEVDYSGDSCMIHPDGSVICQLDRREQLYMIEIQNDVKEVRAVFPTKRDRREDLYYELYNLSKSNEDF